MNKYVAAYVLSYTRSVEVLVVADNDNEAFKKGQDLLCNSDSVSISRDCYTKTGDPESPFIWSVRRVDEWPEPDESAQQIQLRDRSVEVVRELVAVFDRGMTWGSLKAVAEKAYKVLGRAYNDR